MGAGIYAGYETMSAHADIRSLQRMALVTASWLVVLVGFSVPISVALDNVLLALILLGVLASLRSISGIVRSHPIAHAAMLLFVILVMAMVYGTTPWMDALSVVGKYVDLIFVPIFIYFLVRGGYRRRARYAYLAAMAITLFLSYLVGLQLIEPMAWMNQYTTPNNPFIFHSHITQNNMMVFAIFLALLESRDAVTRTARIGWGMFALLGAINILFMVQGRTGYLILLALLGWFVWVTLARHRHARGRAWGWRHGVIILSATLAVVLAAYHLSSRLHERVALAISEYQAWSPGQGKDTSTGQRLDFYYNTLQIVRDHPFVGVGTGGFPAAFKQQVQGTDVLLTSNPHNEYLLIAAQAGLIGLALLLYLFYMLWRYAPLLPSPLEQDAARGLVLAYMVNCMFNSALHDHADGLLFAFMTAVLFAGLRPESAHG